MISPPRGTVYLVDTPLSNDNEHQIKFSNTTEQQSYFNSLPNGIVRDYNYIRHENTMEITVNYYDAIKYNYLIYQNTIVNGKWFYYFIESFEFVNDNVTRLILKIDVWQTWQFELDFQKSFIERRTHSLDGMNTLADTPSPGELIEYKSTSTNFNGAYFVFCNSDVTKIENSTSSAYSFKIGGFSIPSLVLMYKQNQANVMSADLQVLANNGVGDRINSVVYVPSLGNLEAFVVNNITSAITGQTLPICTGTNYPEEVVKQTITFDYSNVNLGLSKCLSSPYTKIVVQDMSTGQTIELEPNRFPSKIVEFEIQSSISETPFYRVIPKNYRGQTYSYSNALVVKCNTSLPVANNTYAKYLMNNQDMNNLKMVGSGVGIVGSAIGGSPMGAITGFESITNVMLQEQQAQRQPNQLSSIQDGAMDRIQFQNGIKIMLMTMDTDHLKTANDYWKMFGYPVRSLEYPDIYSTLDYQFIKTQNANIDGSLPQKDLEEIQNIFNKGVTMWKADKFRQY